MHHYEFEHHVKRLICYFQGQGHCKSSSVQNVTIPTVSFELLILLLPNLILWCSIMSQSTMLRKKKNLQGQGHSEGSYQNVTLSTIFSELWILWQPDVVWWYIIISQSVLCREKGLMHSGSRSQQRVKMLMCVQMISSKSPNILFQNLVLRCIIMSQSVMHKDWFAIFNV